MTTIPMSEIPAWSKSYHERIEGNRDFCEPMTNILKREFDLEIDHSYALKPGQSGIRTKGLTQYLG